MVEGGELVAVKRGRPADGPRLAAEAARLRAARHPGVVELIEAEATGTPDAGLPVLRTRLAGSTTLATRHLPPDRAAAVEAELRTTVAALHARGIVHGRISPDHVVLAPGTRPVLCGFGDGLGADGAPLPPAVDLAALDELFGCPPPPSGSAATSRRVGVRAGWRRGTGGVPRVAVGGLALVATVVGTAAGSGLLGSPEVSSPRRRCPEPAEVAASARADVAVDVDGDGCPEPVRWH